MNDNTSNTPDNASRPGKKNSRPRHPNGKFMTNAEIAEQKKAKFQLEIPEVFLADETGQAPIRRMVEEDLTIEGFENLPLAGSNGELTVGEFLDKVHKFEENGPLAEVIRSTEPRKPTRIGQHVDVEHKTTAGHTRREKVKHTNGRPPVTDRRRTMMYQIRTLPGNRGYGLYYADGVPFDHQMRSAKDIVKHWLGDNWYQSFSDGAARVFATPDAARKFRREHFTTMGVDDEATRERREERQAGARIHRRVVGNRLARNEVRRQPNKTVKKVHKVREDLIKLRTLTGK